MDGRIQSPVSTGWLFQIWDGIAGELNSIRSMDRRWTENWNMYQRRWIFLFRDSWSLFPKSRSKCSNWHFLPSFWLIYRWREAAGGITSPSLQSSSIRSSLWCENVTIRFPRCMSSTTASCRFPSGGELNSPQVSGGSDPRLACKYGEVWRWIKDQLCWWWRSSSLVLRLGTYEISTHGMSFWIPSEIIAFCLKDFYAIFLKQVLASLL